jgi:hypothetical protein
MVKAATRRSWTNKSVRALMQRARSDDPERVIRDEAKRLVANAKAAGWSGPPFRPLELASFLGIRSKPAKDLFSDEAQLRPLPGRQLLLEFNPERAAVRQNYSICHEIVHTFFDDCYEIVHNRRSNPKRFGPEEELESLCQIGAAELLMPEAEFRENLGEVDLSLSSVRFFVDRYQASREAVIRRMVDLSDRTCAAVFLSQRLSPREQSGQKSVSNPVIQPRMRILYRTRRNDFPCYLPPHKSAPDDSCVHGAKMVDVVVTQKERWDIPGFGRWKVEAMALPIPDNAGEDVPSVAVLVVP